MGKTVADLSHKPQQIITGKDNVVMPVVLETIENGRALDVSKYDRDHIYGGQVIVKKKGEASYAPLNVKDGKYEALGADQVFVGFQYGTIDKTRPLGAIMIRGTVVTEASPYPLDTILEDLKKALPLIHFKTKED